jgi:hypothetical protein
VLWVIQQNRKEHSPAGVGLRNRPVGCRIVQDGCRISSDEHQSGGKQCVVAVVLCVRRDYRTRRWIVQQWRDKLAVDATDQHSPVW